MNYDELEYVIFALMFFPLFYISNNDLKFITTKIDKYIVFAIWVLVISNLLVLLNYFIFDVLPFHGYEGSLLIRFGGFWDDPNAFSIFSCFLLFYSCHKKLWLESALLIINVVFAISFTGYVLLMVILFFYMIRNNNVLLFGIILLLVIALVGYLNLDFIEAIYELKKGSLESHSTGLVKFSVLPLTQPLIFHETWFISFMINYSPVSYIVIVIVLYYFIKIYFKGSYSIQNSLFLIFVISSLFLPFLYMFPLNILGFMLFVLNSKNIKF
ncbi:MAG: hypothetical protein NXI00_17340 [Cytophagales bacterium]|nr:hypothetical protein [Cytophagales bacterium]